MSCFKLGTLSLTMGREHDSGFKLNGSSCVRLAARRVIMWVAGLVDGGRLLVSKGLLNLIRFVPLDAATLLVSLHTPLL